MEAYTAPSFADCAPSLNSNLPFPSSRVRRQKLSASLNSLAHYDNLIPPYPVV
jgi:hypothetical protein